MKAEYLAEARNVSQMPTDPVREIAFGGRSNVGKSTLLNRLSQRHGLARTSRTPGCTRGIVLFELTLRDGTVLRVADLPGYGFAARSGDERKGWGPMIESYLQTRESLAAMVVLVDGRRGLEPEEHQLLEYLRFLGRDHLVAVTKTDKLSRAERGAVIARIGRESGTLAVGVSGETGDGRELLMRHIVRKLALPPLVAPDESETPTPEA